MKHHMNAYLVATHQLIPRLHHSPEPSVARGGARDWIVGLVHRKVIPTTERCQHYLQRIEDASTQYPEVVVMGL